MQCNLEDFEVVADGRCLEQVSTEGSHLAICGNRIFGAGSHSGIRVDPVAAPIHRDIGIEPSVEVLGVEIRGNHLHVDTPTSPAGLTGISLKGLASDPVWLRRVVIDGDRISTA
jgi:hypothetical protein